MSYLGFNVLYTVEALEKHSNEKIVIIQTKNTRVQFESKENRIVIAPPSHLFSIISRIRSVYHLATSDRVFVDNYYGFLAATNFKKEVKCIQLWHANGAVKKFGLTDASVQERSDKARKRFQHVYNRFDYVVVGSEKMATIFSESFGLPTERMLKTGVPRTDLFFDEKKKTNIIASLHQQYPIIKGKKVILYTPTYRDGQTSVTDSPLLIDQLQHHLQAEYVLLVKYHPVLQPSEQTIDSSFVLDVTRHQNVNELLLIADILISDYSSIPFEYALLEKPMIFYAYDLDTYNQDRGIWGDYQELVGGPIATTTEEIISIIQQQSFDMDNVRRLNRIWNEYSTGESSEKLIRTLYEKR